MEAYKELRAAGKSMHSKVMAATKELGFDPIKIARRMTLPMSGRTLIFHDETAQNAFFDFWFHKYRVGGRSLVESVKGERAAVGMLITPGEIDVAGLAGLDVTLELVDGPRFRELIARYLPHRLAQLERKRGFRPAPPSREAVSLP